MNIHIHETAIVSDKAIIADDVKIGPFCIIGPQVSIGAGTVLESHVTLDGDTTIGENNYIYSFVSIGKMPQDIDYLNEHTKITIGNNNKIREFVTIHRGTEDKFETKIENNCLIMAYVHIGNDCTIESNDVEFKNSPQTGDNSVSNMGDAEYLKKIEEEEAKANDKLEKEASEEDQTEEED